MAKRRAVLVAIDAANHDIEAKENGANLHYGAALAYGSRQGTVRQAGFYAARVNGLPERERRRLIELKQAGFNRIVVRPLRQRGDGSVKSDIDTVIAMDVWAAVVRKEVDVVALFSGDSDFVPLVERMVELGIEVHVVGPDRCTAWELAAAATCFLYASQLDGFTQPLPPAREAPVEQPRPEADRAPALTGGRNGAFPAVAKPG